MVLSLVTPTGPNFIKDFPGQNAVNCDRVDDYAGPCLITHPLQTFTPGLAGSTTDPVLGTGGINRAFMYEIFDQIYLWGEFRFGTAGINAGSGIYLINLPFNCDSPFVGASNILGNSPVVGNGTVMDANLNAGRLPLTVHLRAANQLFFGIKLTSGLGNRELRESGYITWAINDGVTWAARVKRLP